MAPDLVQEAVSLFYNPSRHPAIQKADKPNRISFEGVILYLLGLGISVEWAIEAFGAYLDLPYTERMLELERIYNQHPTPKQE